MPGDKGKIGPAVSEEFAIEAKKDATVAVIHPTPDRVALSKAGTEPSLHFSRCVKDTTVVTVITKAQSIPTGHPAGTRIILGGKANRDAINGGGGWRHWCSNAGSGWQWGQDGDFVVTHEPWGKMDLVLVNKGFHKGSWVGVFSSQKRHEFVPSLEIGRLWKGCIGLHRSITPPGDAHKLQYLASLVSAGPKEFLSRRSSTIPTVLARGVAVVVGAVVLVQGTLTKGRGTGACVQRKEKR